MMNFPLAWNPAFRQFPVGEDRVLFISEEEYFLLTQIGFDELNNVIRNGGSLADYVFSADNTLEQVNRLKSVDQLTHDGILNSTKPSEPTFFLPTFSSNVRIIQADEFRIYWLSEYAGQYAQALEHAFIEQLKGCTSHPNIQACVVIDDFLDPRLVALQHMFTTESIGWLPIKIFGRTMFGPQFNSLAPNQPCIGCLQTRIQYNQPVREWLRRQRKENHVMPVPVGIDYSRATQVITQVTESLSIQTPTPLITLINADGSIQHHGITKTSNCLICGEEASFNSTIELSEQVKHKDTDGGYRTVSRAATLEKLHQLISPLTGFITDLKLISRASESNSPTASHLSIYRAAYFQNSFASAAPSADTFVQLALGKGVSAKQAQASALGEAIERLAAQYQGNEAIEYGTPEAFTARCIPPQELTPFSAAQYEMFTQLSGVSVKDPQWVQAYSPATPMHWIRGYSLTQNATVFFPAAYCLANTPFDDHIYSLYNHNGNAAGNTLEEAILQGTLELIERDATAVWWYNQIPRPEIDLTIIDPDNLAVIDRTLGPDWDYWLLDITNNIAVPCCAAVGQHKQTGKFVLGFGCHLDPGIACQRALTEMYQLVVIKDEVTGPFEFNAICAHPHLFPKSNAGKRIRRDFPVIDNNRLKDDILYLQEVLEMRNLELCVVNYSRADLPLKTVKVIVPGLCHFWPQNASQRLYAVPVDCQWLSEPLTEQQLNPLALYL